MKFSVVIPLYNKAPYIKHTIDSVLSQTFVDFEIIVVNDGSTDGGEKIVDLIQDSRIRLVTQKNMGVSVARNRGIEFAHEEYVAFLDADDEWAPSFLKEISYLIHEFPDCGAFATAYIIVKPSGQMTYPRIKGIKEGWKGIITRPFIVFQSGLPFNSSSLVVQKKALLDIGGYKEGLNLGEDLLLWNWIALKYPIAYSASRLSIYHKEATNRLSKKVIISNDNDSCINFVDTVVSSDSIDPILKSDLLQYRQYRCLIKAREAIFTGNPRIGKKYLGQISGDRKFRFQLLFFRLLCLLPGKWVAAAYRIYKK